MFNKTKFSVKSILICLCGGDMSFYQIGVVFVTLAKAGHYYKDRTLHCCIFRKSVEYTKKTRRFICTVSLLTLED
ncbi:hypothetical protein ACU8KH_01921 [Lachancea thermotolerans]